MGMTDNQYLSGQKRLLRLLEGVQEELQIKHSVTSEKLEVLIKDIEEELKRP